MKKMLKYESQFHAAKLPGLAQRRKYELSCLQHSKPAVQLSATVATENCAICIDKLSSGPNVTQVGCGHWFHVACLGAWLRENLSCPVCRYAYAPQLSESPCFVCSALDRPTTRGPFVQMNCCGQIMHKQHLADWFWRTQRSSCMVCGTQLVEDVQRWYAERIAS